MNEPENHPEALDLRAYLRPIWRRKWVVLAIVVVATVATYLISSSQQKTYVATATLYVQTADPTQDITSTGALGAPSGQALSDVAQLLLSQADANTVAQRLGMPVSAAGSVIASPTSGSDFISVTATSHSPVLAARLANTYVTVFLHSREQAVRAEAVRDQRAARATLATISKNKNNPTAVGQRQTLLQQIETYAQIELNPSPGAQQINTATVPGLPSSPQPKRDAIFGGVVGLLLGLIAAFVIELLDRRLSRVGTVESIFGRPILAVLPHVSDAMPLSEGQRPIVPPQFLEELRSLTVMLRLAGNPDPPRTIMVTSALPHEGKSTVTRNLALVYAEAGDRVLVIDGDLRRPSMERLFGITADRGLVHILRGGASLSEVVVAATRASDGPDVSSNGHGQDRSPAGTPEMRGTIDVLAHGERLDSPLALLSSERMVTLLEDAYEAYDIVLLDTPPVLTVADSVPLLEVVDSVLLVARLGQTTRHAADRFKELVERLPDVTFSGVIANDRREQLDDEGYGSYGRYGNRYYSGTKPSKREQKAGTTPS
jgi:Mrp family chromosome partitioning ATPase/capsular polysaccharide biosynthesis protein